MAQLAGLTRRPDRTLVSPGDRRYRHPRQWVPNYNGRLWNHAVVGHYFGAFIGRRMMLVAESASGIVRAPRSSTPSLIS
jgi:hypothetical protein